MLQYFKRPRWRVHRLQQKVYPKESPSRTKGDIVGYSDDDSADETSDKASTDNSCDEESKDDDVESEDEIKLLPATVDGLGTKLWKEFMREEKQEHWNEVVSILERFFFLNSILIQQDVQLIITNKTPVQNTNIYKTANKTLYSNPLPPPPPPPPPNPRSE